MWAIFASLSAVFAALVAVFGKLGLQNLDSTIATTIRSIIMAAFLVIVSLFLGKFTNFDFSSLGTKEWVLISLAGVAGALSWLFYFFALQTGNATAVVAIDRLSIVIVAVLAVLFLGEALTWKVALGVALMVSGAILISVK